MQPGIPCNQSTGCYTMLFLATYPDHPVSEPHICCLCAILLLPVPQVVMGSQSCHHHLALCGEVRKCIFHKAHSSWWIDRAAGAVLCVPTVGAPLCQVLFREWQGVPWLGISHGKPPGLAGTGREGLGWDRLRYSRGEGWLYWAGSVVRVLLWESCTGSITAGFL